MDESKSSRGRALAIWLLTVGVSLAVIGGLWLYGRSAPLTAAQREAGVPAAMPLSLWQESEDYTAEAPAAPEAAEEYDRNLHGAPVAMGDAAYVAEQAIGGTDVSAAEVATEDDRTFVRLTATNALIHDYKVCKANGDNDVAEEIKNNFRFYLKSCYNLHYQTDDNVISNAQRFKKCEKMLDSID